jgi:MoaA/NifB/PqqE/SkfB family radical SAM enzyme
MCDIWKANSTKNEISVETLQKHTMIFERLGVREIVFSGGEALMHSNLWRFCDVLKKINIKLTLLSTGLLLEKNALEITRYIDSVIISIDGSQPVHDKIRNIPGGFSKIAAGITAIRRIKPEFRISGRCVLQRFNFADFENIVVSSRELGLSQISFLGADVSSSAFNHPDGLVNDRVSEITLTNSEIIEFEKIVSNSFAVLKQDYESKFIAERPEKMMKIVQYYKALNGHSPYPKVICNAPWVSTVIESNGDVMPCFFHKPYGNIYIDQLDSILNSPEAVSFRKNLNIDADPICKKCVCSLKLSLTKLN